MEKTVSGKITVLPETQIELMRRKDKFKWKEKRPKLTWDKFLLEATKKWGEKDV